MSEQETALTDEQAQERIRNMFIALDDIYTLHKPNTTEEQWVCEHCTNCDGEVNWPCPTAKIILDTLGVTGKTPAE